MKLKEEIEIGEALLKKYKRIIDAMQQLPEPGLGSDVTYRGIFIVLEIEAIKVSERIPQIEKKLEEKKKQYAVEFEKASQETNSKMHIIVNEAKQFFGQEPAGISDKMKSLVESYESNPDMDQESKNDIYDNLKGNNAFMKKRYKK